MTLGTPDTDLTPPPGHPRHRSPLVNDVTSKPLAASNGVFALRQGAVPEERRDGRAKSVGGARAAPDGADPVRRQPSRMPTRSCLGLADIGDPLGA